MDDHSTKLSSVVITLNEEKRIASCLQSLSSVADEIIVIDSFSFDDTPRICREFGVCFFQYIYSGQIEQKNLALSLTSYDHVLALDGDEVLSDELIHEIQQQKSKAFPADGYFMNRLTNYAGQWIRHGGWYPDRKLRLWEKSTAVWGGNNPHDQVLMQNQTKVMTLKGNLLHYGFESIAEHRSRINNYAEIGAGSLYKKGRKFNYLQLYMSPSFKFVRDYLFRLGFLDGKHGWVIATLSAKTKYLKYLKLKKLYSQTK